MAQQNGGAFDPVLFGDYRDPQDNILNNNTFGDFFNDAFPLQDFGTPYYTGEGQAKQGLMKEIEVQKDASPSEFVPENDKTQFLACDKLWFVHCVLATAVISLANFSALQGPCPIFGESAKRGGRHG